MRPIRIGIGGWTYAAWRDNFYPAGLKHVDELAYASARLGSIEINGTFYRTQTPDIFRTWRDATPEKFVFSVKAARAAAQRTDPGLAADSVERFLGSGHAQLDGKRGPMRREQPPPPRFDADAMARSLDLLPASREGVALRHALEARHESFASPEARTLLSARNIALVTVDREAGAPEPPPPTADFVYLRLQSTVDAEPLGYSEAALDAWAERLRGASARRDVFAYVIAGAKHRAPAAAMALIARTASCGKAVAPSS